MPQRLLADSAGRSPVSAVAREALLASLDEGWADPGRLHAEGRRARRLLDAARATFAEVLGCRDDEIRFDRSHPDALRRAVTSVTWARRRVGATVVASAVERRVVLDQAAATGPAGLVEVPVDGTGAVRTDEWAAAVAADGVALAALQHANGEVGTCQPLALAHDACRERGVPLLVDAGASAGHAPLGQAWDLLALDPADWGALGGIAVLAVRHGTRTAADPAAPDDDPRLPPGISVPLAVAAAASLRAAAVMLEGEAAGRRAALDAVRTALAGVPDVQVLGDRDRGLPHVLAFSCLYVHGETVLRELDRLGIAVGSGSACTSDLERPSHVLAAMDVLTHGNVRLTLPIGTTVDDVVPLCRALPEVVAAARREIGATGL